MIKTGKKIQIKHNVTEEVIYTFVVPVETTDDEIQEAENKLGEMINEYCDAHNDDCSEMNWDRIIIKAFIDSGIDVSPLVCDYTLYI